MLPYDGASTKEELRRDLDVLITEAFSNGVVVGNGGYSLEHDDPKVPDWEVQITTMAKPALSSK